MPPTNQNGIAAMGNNSKSQFKKRHKNLSPDYYSNKPNSVNHSSNSNNQMLPFHSASNKSENDNYIQKVKKELEHINVIKKFFCLYN